MGEVVFFLFREKGMHKCLPAGWVMLIMIIVRLLACVYGTYCFQGAFTYAVASGGPGQQLILLQPTEGLEKCRVIRGPVDLSELIFNSSDCGGEGFAHQKGDPFAFGGSSQAPYCFQ